MESSSSDPFGNSELFAEFERDSDGELPQAARTHSHHIRFNESGESDNESEMEELLSSKKLIMNGEKSGVIKDSDDGKKRVPVDPDCCVQVLYTDKTFSTRHKDAIEDFIMKLIAENRDEISDSHDSETLEISNFYKNFLVDQKGCKSSESSILSEGTLPVFEQVYRKALPCESESEEDEDACPQTKNGKKGGSSCWNCGGSHSLHECKEKKDHSKIAINRAAFMADRQENAQNSPDSRYHADEDPRFSGFKAGQVSDSLREAMGIGSDDIPPFIYLMRNHGYPPGHLIEAALSSSDISMFDKHGKEVTKDGQQMEDGEVDDLSSKGGYDYNKIIEYPGFNVASESAMDSENPPMNEFQLKTNLQKIFRPGMFRTIDGLERDKGENVQDREESDMDLGADGSPISPKKRIATPLSDGQCTESGESIEDLELEKQRILDSLQNASTTEDSTTEAESTAPESDAESIQLSNKLVTPKNSRNRSVLKNLGTPVGVNFDVKIPEADKFREDISEHIPYENLPNATGMFSKMMDVLGNVRNTLAQLKK